MEKKAREIVNFLPTWARVIVRESDRALADAFEYRRLHVAWKSALYDVLVRRTDNIALFDKIEKVTKKKLKLFDEMYSKDRKNAAKRVRRVAEIAYRKLGGGK